MFSQIFIILGLKLINTILSTVEVEMNQPIKLKPFTLGQNSSLLINLELIAEDITI